MSKVASYQDPALPDVLIRTRDQWISDLAYHEMVQKSVISCTDAVVTVTGDTAIYLGKRAVFPMKGIWVLGGRIFFNDATVHEAIARSIKLETGVDFLPERFTFLRTNFYAWERVQQGDFPGKNLALVFRLDVSRAELEHMERGLTLKEYDPGFGLQRFDRARLLDEKVHPALVDLFDDIFPS